MGTKTDPYRILDMHDWAWGLCLVAFLWLTPLGTLGGGVILATNELPQVNFIAVPQDFQLVPRDPSTNTASVRIAGMVLDPGYDVIRARVYREGALYGPDHLIALEYVNGVAPFCTRTSIVAELADYAFEVYIAQGTKSSLAWAMLLLGSSST